MKMLLLLALAYSNSGGALSAGAIVEVGDAPDQISDERATDMVPAYATALDENGEPVEAAPADAPAKGKGKASDPAPAE